MHLFCPGPVKIKEEIKNEISKDFEHHRSESFKFLYEKTSNDTLKLFNTSNHKCFFLSGSGSLAVESMIYTFGCDNILILSNGYFGERLINLSDKYNYKFNSINFGYNTIFDYNIIEDSIKQNNYSKIFLIHNETSCGMINDLTEINKLCNKYNIGFYVDGVSSVGAYNIDLSELNKLDCICFSSNKAISCLSGIAIVISKKDILNTKFDNSYLNINLYNKYSDINQTPFTFPYFLLSAYNLAINNILNTGIKNIEELLTNNKNYLIKEMSKLNYKTILDTNISNWVINFKCSNPTKLYNYLYTNNILCYRCKNKLENIAIQICIMNINTEEIDYFIQKIKHFNN